jgi:hypothetical protein
LGTGLYVFTREHDRRALQDVRRQQMLAQSADYEHYLLLNGDPRGVYGKYPPAI